MGRQFILLCLFEVLVSAPDFEKVLVVQIWILLNERLGVFEGAQDACEFVQLVSDLCSSELLP